MLGPTNSKEYRDTNRERRQKIERSLALLFFFVSGKCWRLSSDIRLIRAFCSSPFVFVRSFSFRFWFVVVQGSFEGAKESLGIETDPKRSLGSRDRGRPEPSEVRLDQTRGCSPICSPSLFPSLPLSLSLSLSLSLPSILCKQGEC